MAIGSLNISTNRALTNSSSLASCCLRREIKHSTLSKIAAILFCSSRGKIEISISQILVFRTEGTVVDSEYFCKSNVVIQ